MIVEINPTKIIFEEKFQVLCKAPYKGHPEGCPNFGKHEKCAVSRPLLNEVLDLAKKVYVIYTEFNVGELAEKIRQEHTEWAKEPEKWYDRKGWEPRAKKIHNQERAWALEEYPDITKVCWPESHGVDVVSLMKEFGINLKWQWPPKHVVEGKKYLENKVYTISLGGHNINN